MSFSELLINVLYAASCIWMLRIIGATINQASARIEPKLLNFLITGLCCITLLIPQENIDITTINIILTFIGGIFLSLSQPFFLSERKDAWNYVPRLIGLLALIVVANELFFF